MNIRDINAYPIGHSGICFGTDTIPGANAG